MYAGERPVVVHIANLGNDNEELEAYLGGRNVAPGGGSLDHISLRCHGLAEHQVFVDDPNGIRIELIFPYSPDNAAMGDNLGRLEINAS
jgi:hypothetical protein